MEAREQEFFSKGSGPIQVIGGANLEQGQLALATRAAIISTASAGVTNPAIEVVGPGAMEVASSARARVDGAVKISASSQAPDPGTLKIVLVSPRGWPEELAATGVKVSGGGPASGGVAVSADIANLIGQQPSKAAIAIASSGAAVATLAAPAASGSADPVILRPLKVSANYADIPAIDARPPAPSPDPAMKSAVSVSRPGTTR